MTRSQSENDIPEEFRFRGVRTFRSTLIINPENVTCGNPVLIDDQVTINANGGRINIGSFVHIAGGGTNLFGGEISLDDFVNICSGVKLVAGTDDCLEWGFGNPTVPTEFRNDRRKRITICRFGFVGVNAVVFPGVTIGEGAVVGAGQVLKRDLESWEVYVAKGVSKTRDRKAVLENYQRFLDRYWRYFPHLKPPE